MLPLGHGLLRKGMTIGRLNHWHDHELHDGWERRGGQLHWFKRQ